MHVKFKGIKQGYEFVHNNKKVNIGDVIEVSNNRGQELVNRGVFEKVKQSPSKDKNTNDDEKQEVK